jgi:hypothetical protein
MLRIEQFSSDPARYLNGGDAMDLHDDSTEMDDVHEAIVKLFLLIGPPSDPRNIVDTGIRCGCAPDSKLVGSKRTVQHMENCNVLQDEINAFIDQPLRRRKFKNAKTLYGERIGGMVLPSHRPPTPPKSPPDAATLALWQDEHVGKAVEVPGGYVTPYGPDPDSIPEHTAAPALSVALLVGRRPPDAVRGGAYPNATSTLEIVEVRGLIDLPKSTRTREQLLAWLASHEHDIARHREEIRSDARRLGLRLIFGLRGTPPALATDPGAELADLRARLARLEAAAGDREHHFTFSETP